jgi:hypothetical protein
MENYGSYGSREIDLVIDRVQSHKGKVLKVMGGLNNIFINTNGERIQYLDTDKVNLLL